jgi:hypothetical protein
MKALTDREGNVRTDRIDAALGAAGELIKRLDGKRSGDARPSTFARDGRGQGAGIQR